MAGASIIENITDAAMSILAALRVVDGYNYDWGISNEEDLAHCTFPNAVAQAIDEESLDDEDEADGGAYSNGINIEIRIRHLNASESNNPNYAIRSRLFRALDDVKRAYGKNCSLNSTGDCMLYRGSNFDITRIGNDDIFIPYEIVTRWYIRYTQDKHEPATYA